MQSAAVYFLGEASLQNKRKAFQKGWCKTGFVFQREVDPASLSHFLNWLRRQVPWSQGDAIETLNRNRAELLLCWAALQLETCIQKEGESREAKLQSKTYKPTDVFQCVGFVLNFGSFFFFVLFESTSCYKPWVWC